MKKSITLQGRIVIEFNAIGFMARPSDIIALTDILEAQDAEYDDLSVMAACLGYACAKGKV